MLIGICLVMTMDEPVVNEEQNSLEVPETLAHLSDGFGQEYMTQVNDILLSATVSCCCDEQQNHC